MGDLIPLLFVMISGAPVDFASLVLFIENFLDFLVNLLNLFCDFVLLIFDAALFGEDFFHSLSYILKFFVTFLCFIFYWFEIFVKGFALGL